MSYRWRLFLGEPVGTYGSAVAVFESPLHKTDARLHTRPRYPQPTAQ